MQPNPYSDDQINTQPTEANAVPQARQRPVHPPSYNPNASNVPPYPQNEIRSEQAQRAARNEERAHTAAYGVAKAMDYLRWVLVVLEVVLLLRFLLKLI